MAGCCGCWDKFSLWNQLVKVYKYMSELLSVTHTLKDPADGTRKLSKMDISRLEEQYHCMKEKQKHDTHIIVFKAGENELLSGEPVVNTIPVNEAMKKQKAFKEQIPVKDVTLEVLDKNYLKDRNGTWHAHLNIHRMAQLDCHFALENGTAEDVKEINFENRRPPFTKMLSYDMLPTIEMGNNRKERKFSSFSADNNPISSLYRSSSLKHTIPATWTSLKLTSPTDKLVYYPFPQRKNPRISETARKLGLYVTH